MTANQVAHEANLINAKINEAKLAEESRHNQRIEELSSESNYIERERNQLTEAWNKWQMDYNENFTAKFKEAELAQGEEKLRIEQELADLQSDRDAALKDYQDRLATVNERLEQNDKMLKEAQAFRAYAQNSFDLANVRLNAWEKQIYAKNVEYENANKHESNVIAREFNTAKIDLEKQTLAFNVQSRTAEISNNLYLGKLSADLRSRELDLESKRVMSQIDLNTSQKWYNYSSAIFGSRTGAIPGAFNLVKDITGGINNVKTAQTATKLTKEVAEQLLFK